EDADGFYANVVVGGIVHDSGIGVVGDGAGKDVRAAAAWVSDVHHWNIYCLETAIEIEIQVGELADA
ncbi:MAG TPA: hypothetical protein VN825_05425, partial [Candidatus Acidoferrum sp.]|nr:hypothetical protein [Candidatus Acidoferrum sp.]